MKEIINEIKEKSDKRYELLNEYENSYDDNINDYSIEFPEKIDKLSDQIYNLISVYREILPFEFIIEELTKLGQAPSLLYDDNGHFAITSNGFQSISSNIGKKDDRDDIELSFFVKKYKWANTIREALNKYLDEE